MKFTLKSPHITKLTGFRNNRFSISSNFFYEGIKISCRGSIYWQNAKI